MNKKFNMEENSEFLKYIYNEDLYIIDEPSNSTTDEEKSSKEQIEEQRSTSVVEEPTPVSFFGNNEQGILILVNDPSDELLNQSDLDLLMKIVESGLKYSKNDFALVNTTKFPVDQILDEIGFSYLISFGVDLSNFFSETSFYHIHQIDENKVLFSEALSVLGKDETKKRKLWNALKSMFEIK